MQSVVRPAGGTWQAPVDLSAAGQHASSPQVAVDAHGNTVAVWYRFTGPDTGPSTGSIVQGAVRPAGGTWQAPVDLAVGGNVFAAQLAVGAQGDAVAVWNRASGARSFVVQGAVRAANGAWQEPITLSAAGGNPGNPQVAVDAHGNAIAVWSRSSDSSSSVVQSAVRPARQNWQAPVELAVDAASADVAISPHGNAFAVWHDSRGIAQSAMRSADGSWQAPVDLSAPGQDALETQVAADAHGNAVAIWQRSNGTNQIVQSATYRAPGPQVTRLRLSPSTLRASRWGPTVQAATAPTATQVSYELNAAASVRFTLQRYRGGRRVGGRCVKATTSNRRQKICTRLVRVRGGFTRSRAAGTDRFTFTGRVAGRPLRPGRYGLVATPTDNGRTGTPTRARLRIVR